VRRLVGIGVGPGDPELITVKAVRRLRAADVVFVPVLARPGEEGSAEEGRAEAIVRVHADAARIRRIAFALNDPGGVTPGRAAAWDAAARGVAAAFADGAQTVAFATIGDPAIYSTFSYLAQTVTGLVGDVVIETVPGVTAASDLAARSGITLAEGTESLALLPLTAGADALADALARHDTVVGYKLGSAGGPDVGAVLGLLDEAGRLDDAVFGARLGLPGEDIRPAGELAGGGPVPYLSTLITVRARAGRGSRLGAGGGGDRPA
jgi:precorrin-2/cobalt-factor-2 C20-methyltransferase